MEWASQRLKIRTIWSTSWLVVPKPPSFAAPPQNLLHSSTISNASLSDRMLAVTKPVESALQKGCDAWQLQLDKFSFQRQGDVSAKTDSLKKVCECYAQRSARHLIGACRSRQRLLIMLQRQHEPWFATIELILESKLLLHLGRA